MASWEWRTASSMFRLANEADYVARPVSPVTLALATVFFLAAALSVLSSKQRNQDFFYKPGDPRSSVGRGMDRARAAMGIALGCWGLLLLLNFLAPEPGAAGITFVMTVLGLAGLALILVSGSVVLFNWPKFATPVKFREDPSPVARFLQRRSGA